MEDETGLEGRGVEWGAPGCPRVQLKETVASPPLVLRLREASPPRAQMLMNSLTEAPRNWEFDLEDIFNQMGLAGDRIIL